MQVNNESLYGITLHKASDYRLKVNVDGVSLANLEPRFRLVAKGNEFNLDRFAQISGSDIFIMVPLKNIKRIPAGHWRYSIAVANGEQADVVLFGNAKVVE